MRSALVEAIDLAGLDGRATRDPAQLARAVQQFVQQRVRYLREYPETYQSVARTLEWGVGDCDDMSPVVAAMARTARIPARLCIVGWDEPAGGPLRPRHVYGQLLVPAEPGAEPVWRTAETVRPVPLGWDAGEWKRSKGHRVAYSYVGDRGPLA